MSSLSCYCHQTLSFLFPPFVWYYYGKERVERGWGEKYRLRRRRRLDWKEEILCQQHVSLRRHCHVFLSSVFLFSHLVWERSGSGLKGFFNFGNQWDLRDIPALLLSLPLCYFENRSNFRPDFSDKKCSYSYTAIKFTNSKNVVLPIGYFWLTFCNFVFAQFYPPKDWDDTIERSFICSHAAAFSRQTKTCLSRALLFLSGKYSGKHNDRRWGSQWLEKRRSWEKPMMMQLRREREKGMVSTSSRKEEQSRGVEGLINLAPPTPPFPKKSRVTNPAILKEGGREKREDRWASYFFFWVGTGILWPIFVHSRFLGNVFPFLFHSQTGEIYNTLWGSETKTF